ncbi:MucR family transcriptional regulator [Mesorhizobium sp. M2D.F.Ca.ET.223.01.1.1]|uniref:MucR family transcriptional regulator n=1 Tax=Mesorhizobium sp. M2D.F.Ca.ET.223.01.1.1 TaxID=2563940 RepID=UPI001091B4CD|nr:MucR family transcriptional regulator [Mesorhizobium sp. M2D.F.Ca.ET.223.01.1.1]TGR84551.1 MucR family transcriptional regulator [Mesorhizobium sp. M2D.F.Ca.ET.223.01.1.1]TGT78425.1 MucR family transcriptional regulator [bacterium M00.F.Ca.ET.159.01.1.1]TGT89092.1 MucR family transcriptional regulator [bacterium M00.F.Ca.ET.157.01.1.1]
MAAEELRTPFIELTADIVSAYVSNNPVPVSELPSVIDRIFQSLSTLQSGDQKLQTEPLKPAVPIKKSVTPDFIISLEDGKKFKSLRRHLQTAYNLSPDEYREKWGLPSDYPMVAPNYAATRSALAKKFGLGRKPQEAAKPVRRKRS